MAFSNFFLNSFAVPRSPGFTKLTKLKNPKNLIFLQEFQSIPTWNTPANRSEWAFPKWELFWDIWARSALDTSGFRCFSGGDPRENQGKSRNPFRKGYLITDNDSDVSRMQNIGVETECLVGNDEDWNGTPHLRVSHERGCKVTFSNYFFIIVKNWIELGKTMGFS